LVIVGAASRLVAVVAVAALPLILASTAVVLVILNLVPSQVIAPPVNLAV